MHSALVLGNLLDLRNRPLDFLLEMSREFGEIAIFHVGSRPVVFINSSEYIHTVLVERADNFEKTPNVRDYLRPMLGNGLLISLNEFHKRQRKLVAPAFQHRRIVTFADIMASYTEQMQETWPDGVVLDVAAEMMHLTLEIVAKTLFDSNLAAETGELGDALTVAMHYTIGKFSALVQTPLTWPTPGNMRFQKARARLDATIYRLITERRHSGKDRGDLMSMLLRACNEDDGTFMNDAQLRDEVMTLILAGHETTANALAWTWYLLAKHPDVYARLREEVDRVLSGRTPAFADLPNLPYVLQVLKESMRVYPPAWVIGRYAIKQTQLGDHVIPANTAVTISPYALHRRPDYFPDPERFDPDRFVLEAEQLLPRQAYLPFGAGPRICIGNQFAMMEAQIILTTLAQRVTFELAPGQGPVEPEPLVALRPRGGIRMVVHRRA